jgi:pimeloyl-ACP methyl ester carboxylesterase
VLAATVGVDYVEGIMNDLEKYRAFTEFLSSVALLSRRREGTINDGRQFLGFSNYPFKSITCPTLILYGSKDTFVPLAEQVYLSETLPNSEYIEIEGGTHFMVISHDDVIAPIIMDFLNARVPANRY